MCRGVSLHGGAAHCLDSVWSGVEDRERLGMSNGILTDCGTHFMSKLQQQVYHWLGLSWDRPKMERLV